MSFFGDIWDVIETGTSAITGDEDTLYPDNPNRRARANQLYTDSKEFIISIRSEKQRAQHILDELHVKYQSVLPESTYDFKSWQVNSPANLHQVLDIVGVFNAYSLAGVLCITDNDKQDELLNVVDIPFGFKLIEIEGVPIIPIGGITGGAIGGAETRSKLQAYIHQAVQSRKEIYLQLMILQCINQGLEELGEKEDLIKLGYTNEQIDQLFKKKLSKVEGSYQQLSIQDANKALDLRDYQRHAWTNEDHC